MARMIPGLVSVTYRSMTAEEIIAAAKDANLSAIEWGGDIHVPHGAVDTARRVGELTRKAGLSVISYGTYYRAGAYADPTAEFEKMLDTAEALGAPSLRLWAGSANSGEVPEDTRCAWTEELRRCASLAAARGMSIAFEYHKGTLTDTAASAVRLIRELHADNASLYWQPDQFASFADNLANLQTVLPYVSNVHVFAWSARSRFPLMTQKEQWDAYLSLLSGTGRTHGMLLEFVPEDAPQALPTEAAALQTLLRPYQC